jgi:hypothetical protein
VLAGVIDMAGNPLHGDAEVRIDVLPGDASRNGVVLGDDVGLVALPQFQEIDSSGVPTPLYSKYLDVNGSGQIFFTDVGQVRLKQFKKLPDGEPTPPPAPVVAIAEELEAVAFIAPAAAPVVVSTPNAAAEKNDVAEAGFTVSTIPANAWVAAPVNRGLQTPRLARGAYRPPTQAVATDPRVVSAAVALTTSPSTASAFESELNDDDGRPEAVLAAVDAAIGDLWGG